MILEQVSPSVCQDIDDWGGVDRTFWYEAPERYGWPVDSSTLKVRLAEVGNKDGRYHVFMRKSLEDEPETETP